MTNDINVMSIKRILVSLIPKRFNLRVKYAYQFLKRLSSNKRKIETNYELKKLSKPNTHVFFGYYDVTPFNTETDEIIYLNLKKDEDVIQIMTNHLEDLSQERKLADSRAWNWQQGIRLRWMPNNSREIVFNDFDGKVYYSRIVNIDTKEERRIDAPLYDISSDGRFGLSIDFERLGAKRPGYGYTCRPYIEAEHQLENESIRLVDLANNTIRDIITFADIANINGCETKDFSNNYLNHLCFSPSGHQFLFFWLTVKSHTHKAYLLVHNLISGKTKLIENSEKVSHYVWLNEDTIICTARDNDGRDHYHRYTVSTGEKKTLCPAILCYDGHPSVYSKELILTDTYPDTMGYQHLYLANIDKSLKRPVLDIYSNCMITGERRTDLHPRLNTGKTMVCLDANILKYRELYFIKIDKLK